MVCKGCGKEIPEGFEYCEDCDKSMQEAEVITVTKSDMKKSKDKKREGRIEDRVIRTNKPMPRDDVAVDLEGYWGAIRKDMATLAAVIGAVCLYLAPFFSWVWRENRKLKQTGNLFDLAGKNVQEIGVEKTVYTMGITIFFVFAVLTILAACYLLVFSACDYIPALRTLGDSEIVRILVLAALAVVFVLIVRNGTYSNLLHAIGRSVKNGDCEGGFGPGLVLYITGWVFSAVAVVGNRIGQRK